MIEVSNSLLYNFIMASASASASKDWNVINLGGPDGDGEVVVWMSRLPGLHQPFGSTENWKKSCKTLTDLWSDVGTVKECFFQKCRGSSKCCSAYVQFEAGSVDPDFLEILREKGVYTFTAPINRRHNWDYHVHVSKFEFVNAEERLRRRRASKKRSLVKFSMKPKAASLSSDDDDNDVLSD